jgi:hydrogenase nickel incorporation protein HypA/HybF
MHEAGLAEGILAVVEDVAGMRPVRRVTLSVGEQQAVAADSLRFAFDLVAEGTSAAGARLELNTVPGDRLLVDEVELDGEPPEVIRRPSDP